MTGPVLRSTGYPWDLRKTQPYSGYEDYDFDVVTRDSMDAYGRFRIRLDEMWESLRIVEQAADRLAGLEGGPIMVADKKIACSASTAMSTASSAKSIPSGPHNAKVSLAAAISALAGAGPYWPRERACRNRVRRASPSRITA